MAGKDAVYGGFSPYNYLAAQSPTDTHSPTSPTPLLSGSITNPRRDSDPPVFGAGDDDEEAKQPYNYLNPNAPAPFQRDGSFRPTDNYSAQRRHNPQSSDIAEPGDVNPALNPAFTGGGGDPGDDMNTLSSSSGAQFYPARREHVDYSHTYQSNNGAPVARHNSGALAARTNGAMNSPRGAHAEKPYTIPEQDYSMTDGKIPRPHYGASGLSSSSGGKYDNQAAHKSNSSNAGGFDDPTSKHSRPLGGEDYLNDRYKGDSRDSNKVLRVCGILLLVLLCLGIGFAAGWFASKYLNEEDSSSESSAETTLGDLVSSTLPQMTATTTTTQPTPDPTDPPASALTTEVAMETVT